MPSAGAKGGGRQGPAMMTEWQSMSLEEKPRARVASTSQLAEAEAEALAAAQAEKVAADALANARAQVTQRRAQLFAWTLDCVTREHMVEEIAKAEAGLQLAHAKQDEAEARMNRAALKLDRAAQLETDAQADAAATEAGSLQQRFHSGGVLIGGASATADKDLLGAAELGDHDALMTALGDGAKLDVVDEKTHTALHWAAKCGRADDIEALVAADATLNAKTIKVPHERPDERQSLLAAAKGLCPQPRTAAERQQARERKRAQGGGGGGKRGSFSAADPRGGDRVWAGTDNYDLNEVDLELQEALALSLNACDTAGGAAAAAQEHALRNYELFHQLKRGSATYEQVAASSAGIDAWAMSPQTAQHEAEADGWVVPHEGEEGVAEGEPGDPRPVRAGDDLEAKALQRALLASIGVNFDGGAVDGEDRAHWTEQQSDDDEAH